MPLSFPPQLPAGESIVIALTRHERELFFGDRNLTLIPNVRLLADDDLAPADWAARLAASRPTVLVTAWTTPALPESWLQQADCPLRFVCHVTGSVRRLVPRSFLERGGVITNWGGTVSEQVAEHALLLALGALRNAARWSGFIAAHGDRNGLEQLATRTLFGRRLGLHGFGSVARALIPLLRPFGVSIAAYSAGVPAALMREAGVIPAESLPALFAGSEVLFECEALTPATTASVTAEILALLPDNAVFVNVGRGQLVDEAALAHEARSGRLRLALDVVSAEPLTPNSPFYGLPNVILSPHIAGPTGDRYRQCGENALDNLAAFLRGEPPPGQISLASYDRAT
jgi:phosphoglycerate dehydrogenase-like enzyme